MLKTIKLSLIIICTFAISACQFGKEKISTQPMMTANDGAGPWQLVTYDLKDVKFKAMVVAEHGVITEEIDAYVNNMSLLVDSSGQFLTMSNGNKLYWNDQGKIIDTKLNLIDQARLFVVNGRKMENDTPMTLKEYYQKPVVEKTNETGRVVKEAPLYNPLADTETL